MLEQIEPLELDRSDLPETEDLGRKRALSIAPAPSPFGPPPKKTKSSSTDATTIAVAKTSAFRTGYIMTTSSRSKISDYVAVVQALLLRAMREYEAFVSTKDAFPSTTLQAQWAESCWKSTALATKENYELTDRMAGLVCCLSLLFLHRLII